MMKRLMSIRCTSVTVAIIFIVLASAVICALGYVRQQQLKQEQFSTQLDSLRQICTTQAELEFQWNEDVHYPSE
jgi:Tfp pilus assembly protein PilO